MTKLCILNFSASAIFCTVRLLSRYQNVIKNLLTVFDKLRIKREVLNLKTNKSLFTKYKKM